MSDTYPPASGGDQANQPYGGYGAPPPSGPGYGYGGGGPVGEPPPNHLAWAIITTVLCCLPLGIVSIVYAAQVTGKWSSGDLAGARDSSQKARTFALWGTILGAIGVVLWIVLFTGGLMSMSDLNGGTY